MLKTLKGKFSLIYIALVALTAIVGCVSVLNVISLQKSVDGLMTNNYKSISAVRQMKDAFAKQNDAVVTYISLSNAQGIDEYYGSADDFTKYYGIEAGNVTEKGEQNIVDAVKADYNLYERDFSLLQDTLHAKGQTAGIDYYNNNIMPLYNKITQELNADIDINQTSMFSSKSKAARDAEGSVYILLSLSFLAVLGGFLVSRYFVNRFLKPLSLLTDSLSRVRAGGLDLHIDVRSNDETGKLAAEFNEMTKRLQTYEQSTMGTLVGERNKSMSIVKSIPDPLVVLDNDYRILLINKACESFFEIREADVLGGHLLEHIHNGQLFDLISGSADAPGETAGTILHFDKGEGYYFNVVVTPMKGRDQKTTGYIMLMQNVTELKELERVKTDFVATISHEFKTPLTSIVMGASMLDEEGLGKLSDAQKEVVRTVLEDSQKLSGFVGELLELSRMESGKAIYSFSACSFHAIVENSCRGFYEMAKRGGVSIINGLSTDLPLIYADFEKVTWVLNNLLSNALKYTGGGDTITIGAAVSGAYLEAYVKDTGEGIPQEYIGRIFDKYVQVAGQDIEVRGTGLGLSVAKEIVEAIGGEIHVSSAVGKGSTFIFTLPLYAGQDTDGREG